MTQTSSFSDINLDGIQPPPPAPDLPLAPPAPRAGPPASEIAARSGITHLRYVGLAMADYERSLWFYERTWGLYQIADDGNVAFLGSSDHRSRSSCGSGPRLARGPTSSRSAPATRQAVDDWPRAWAPAACG